MTNSDLGKAISRLILLSLLFVFSYCGAFAQATSATWALTANNSVTVGPNISATGLTTSAGLNLVGFNTTYGVQATNFGGGYCTPTYTAYYEFTVSPAACYDLEVTSITFIYRCSFEPRCYQLFYSISGGPDTQIGGNIDIPLRNTDYNYNSGAISIAVASGETIRFRLYGSGSTASNFGCRNLVVNGTTTIVPATPSVSIAASPASPVCDGTSVTYTPTPTGGGTAPTYQWFLNTVSQGISPTLVTSPAADGDQVYCIMTSNSPCASPSTANSNTITMSVVGAPVSAGVISGSTDVGPGSTGIIYSIAPVADATSYTWMVPAGWTITSGQGSTTITVTSGIVGENGNIAVYAENSCGTSPTSSLAVSVVPPHDLCSQCHITHTSPAGTLTNVVGNSNLCISCHNATGSASGKPLANSMKAQPGVTGTSHQWDIPSVNGTYETNITTNAAMLLRLPGDSIICSTCHNQHVNAAPEFLRISNTGDALCKQCHSARDIGTYASNPLNLGSHPVGTAYNPADSRFLATAVSPVQVVDNNVECSSCHGVHYQSSGGANGGLGDGNLLRTTNDENLCSSCHVFRGTRVYLDHEGMTCVDCHFSHNTGSSNIYLINDVINSKPVVYTGNSSPDNFGDGSGTFDGICEVCHTQTDHYTDDGVGVTADARHHPASQTCTDCHPHNNAFYAQSNCFDCHNAVADKPGVGPAGGRRQIVDASGNGTGAGGDYKRSSHHVTGSIPNVSDCLLCHYMGDHKNGEVKLLDPDQGYNTVYTYTTPESIEDFCLNCHDGDGVEGDVTPFSDGVVAPTIDKTIWLNSSHKGGPYTCLDCHDNGHGSNKDKLLAPYDYTADGSPDPMNDEEEFCENCHNGGTASDIASEFNRTHTHQCDEVNEMGTNSGLECVRCHNPHQNTAANPLSDPDETDILWTQVANGTRDFCLRCHDGAPPAGISFPASAYGTGWDKSNYVDSRHDQVINVGETNYQGTDRDEDCMACHEHHGAAGSAENTFTGVYTMLKARYDKSGNAGAFACNVWATADYALCWTCHNTNLITADNGRFNEHFKHVNGEQAPCIECHDVHNAYDPGENGLINFQYSSSAIYDVDVDPNGNSLSNMFTASRCNLRCHEAPGGCGSMGHSSENYGGTYLPYPWTYTWPK